MCSIAFGRRIAGRRAPRAGWAWGWRSCAISIRLHGGDVDVQATGSATGPPSRSRLRASRQTPARGGPPGAVAQDGQPGRPLRRRGGGSRRQPGAHASQRWKMPARRSSYSDRSAKALDAFEKMRPSALVADIGLPDEDGYGLHPEGPQACVRRRAGRSGHRGDGIRDGGRSRAGARSGLSTASDEAARSR